MPRGRPSLSDVGNTVAWFGHPFLLLLRAMWIMTTYGFFSIVEKPEDREAHTLTIRTRVREDLESLREQFLPSLGPIQDWATSDYRFRARARRAAVEAALVRLTAAIDYDNFKNEVAKTQGDERSRTYSKVWEVLYGLQENGRQRGTPPVRSP